MNRSPSARRAQTGYFRLSPFVLAARTAMLALAFVTPHAGAQTSLPADTGGHFNTVTGTATYNVSGQTGTVLQTTPFAHVTWDQLGVAANETLTFNQRLADGTTPNNSAVILNQVNGGAGTVLMSQILGDLNANGTVILINPAGILVGADAVINVGSLIASSLNLTTPVGTPDENTGPGSIVFTASGDTRVENLGTIGPSSNNDVQSVTLIGRGVTNSGTIRTVDDGSVRLIGTDGVTLTVPTAGSDASIVRGAPTLGALATVAQATATGVAAVENSGTIRSQSGTILLQAAAAPGLIPLINNTGLLIATGSASSPDGGDVQLIGSGGAIVSDGVIVPADTDSIQVAKDGSDVNDSDGSILITTDGAITANGLDAGDGGTVTLTSTNGNITGNTGTDVTGGLLNANAETGITLDTDVDSLSASVSAAGDLTIDEVDSITLTSATTFNGSIDVESLAGSITAGTVTAGSNGNVTLTAAVGGQILDDAPGTADSTRITGNVVTLNGSGGIGSGFNTLNGAVDTEAVSLVLGVLPGSVNINEASDVTFAFPLSPFVGDFTFRQGAALTVADFAATNLSLGTSGAFNLTVGLLNGTTVALASGGSIVDGNVACPALSCNNIAATTLLASAATGINLDTDVSNLTAVVSGVGNLTLRENDAVTLTNVSTSNGSISVIAGGDLTATSVISSTNNEANDVTLTSSTGDLTAGTVTATGAGDVILTATAAGKKILDDDSGNVVSPTRVSGDVVSLSTDSGIGAGFNTRNGALDTEAATLTATTATGAINIDEASGVTLSALSNGGGGSITLRAGGALNVPTINVGSNDLALSTTGGTGSTLSIAGPLTADEVVLASSGAISSVTGNGVTANSLTADAVSGIDLDTSVGALDAEVTGAGSDLIIRETSGIDLTDLDANDGKITVTAATGDIMARSVTATGNGDVVLIASTGAIVDDNANTQISGDVVTLTSGAGIGASGNAVDTTAASLVANAGTGSITLEESGAVTLDSVDAAGSISIAAAGTITASDVESSGSTVTLTASSGGNIAAGRIAGSAVTLSAAAITDGNGTGLNIVSPAGLLSATATSGISLDTQVGSVTATGGNGAVSIREADDLSVVSVSTTNGNSIALTAGGAIADGAGGVNVATSGQFTANAVSGIDLDTNVGSLDASVSGSGNLVVREANAITLTDLDTANGSIIVSAGGTIAASNLASITDSAANDITLTASAGNIVVGTIDAGGSGGVTLLASSSGGQILDDGNDGTPGTTRIRGDVVTLTADAGIGAGDDVDTDANTLAASTGTGPINVDELDGLTISALTTVGGDITLSTGDALVLPASISGQSLNLATRDTGANLTVNGLTAVDTVTLSAAGAILDGNGTGLNVSATTLSATASSGIELDTTVSSVSANGGAGAVTIRETNGLIANGVSGSNVTLSAGGAISGAAGVDVTTDGLFIATAASGINLDTSVATLDGSVTGGGDLVIRESDGLAVVAADAASGNISVTSASGNILVGAVAATAGNVTLSAQGVGGQILDDGNDDAPTTTRIAGNLVALSANAGIGTEAEDVDTDATTLSAITVSGPINIDELNAVTATTVSTGAGGISLSAGDLTLGSVTTPGAVVLSAGGSILDANGTGTNVSANSLNATAGSGIDLDTAVANLSASVSGAGNIVIAELNDLVVDTVQAGSGSVTLSTGGDLSPGSISGTGVTLDVGGGLSFATTDQVDGGAGAVVIETAGGILQDREREGPAVIGSSIAITAGGNVGELTVPLEVDSGGGTVIVNFNDTSSQGFISGVFGSLNESSRVLGLASNSELSGTVGAIQSSFEKRVSFNLDSSQFSTSARIFATEGTAVLLPEDQRE